MCDMDEGAVVSLSVNWSCKAVSKASACAINCSKVWRWPALARMSVWKVLLNNPQINWSLTWSGTRSHWQRGQENSVCCSWF